MTVHEKTIGIWGLDRCEIDRIFDGSNSVVGKWRQQGFLPDTIAELDAATDLLCLYLKQDRIPSVVRRPIPARDEVSLIEMLEQGDSKTLLATCRDMFRFEQVQAEGTRHEPDKYRRWSSRYGFVLDDVADYHALACRILRRTYRGAWA